MYAPMARMSGNDKRYSKDSDDNLKLTNWILDSGSMFHMQSQVSDCIPYLLKDTYKYIEIVDGHYVTEKEK